MQWDSRTQMHVVPFYVNFKFNLTDPLHQEYGYLQLTNSN